MQNYISTITPVEWGLLGIAVVALVIAWLAWRRAGRALQLIHNQPVIEQAGMDEAEQHVEQGPANVLEISANKNEHGQVSLVVSNTGRFAARFVKLEIDEPENVYDAENLSAGINTANVTTSSAIKPRLVILDAKNTLPVSEIRPGTNTELPAALTMSHNKICDFPVVLSWKDENGKNQQKKQTLTV